jgi:hypothetical protein
MNQQQNWIVSVAAPYGDPLLNAADLNRFGLVDAVERDDLAIVCQERLVTIPLYFLRGLGVVVH